METNGSTPARTCFPEKGESRPTRPYADGAHLAPGLDGGDMGGIALASPLRTRISWSPQKCPSGPVTTSPGPKLNIHECKAGKRSFILNRENPETENRGQLDPAREGSCLLFGMLMGLFSLSEERVVLT